MLWIQIFTLGQVGVKTVAVFTPLLVACACARAASALMPAPRPIAAVAADLAAGRTTSARLVDACLQRADDGAGEGARAFVALYREAARAEAAASDALRARGVVRSALEGVPVSARARARDGRRLRRGAYARLQLERARPCLPPSVPSRALPARSLSRLKVSVKDLFDVSGDVTRAGSKASTALVLVKLATWREVGAPGGHCSVVKEKLAARERPSVLPAS